MRRSLIFLDKSLRAIYFGKWDKLLQENNRLIAVPIDTSLLCVSDDFAVLLVLFPSRLSTTYILQSYSSYYRLKFLFSFKLWLQNLIYSVYIRLRFFLFC